MTPCSSTAGPSHSLGEIVTVPSVAGLRIEFLHEHDFTPWAASRSIEDHNGESRVPLMYSLRATRPT